MIPNAILICTESDKHFLTSFTSRDKTYLMLFRVWQNALMNLKMNPQELWQWVSLHSLCLEQLNVILLGTWFDLYFFKWYWFVNKAKLNRLLNFNLSLIRILTCAWDLEEYSLLICLTWIFSLPVSGSQLLRRTVRTD